MRNNKKKGILVLVLLLAIGFAAISTTLTINGTINIGSNADDVKENVKFTAATLQELGTVTGSESTETKVATQAGTVDITDNNATATIADDGKSITFKTNTLDMIGDYAILYYTITNGSQYDVDLADLSCTLTGGDYTNQAITSGSTYGYVKITISSLKQTLAAGATTSGDYTVTVALAKSYASEESLDYTITCTTDATVTTTTTTTNAGV